jgi:hypothetical protein
MYAKKSLPRDLRVDACVRAREAERERERERESLHCSCVLRASGIFKARLDASVIVSQERSLFPIPRYKQSSAIFEWTLASYLYESSFASSYCFPKFSVIVFLL